MPNISYTNLTSVKNVLKTDNNYYYSSCCYIKFFLHSSDVFPALHLFPQILFPLARLPSSPLKSHLFHGALDALPPPSLYLFSLLKFPPPVLLQPSPQPHLPFILPVLSWVLHRRGCLCFYCCCSCDIDPSPTSKEASVRSRGSGMTGGRAD